MVHREIRLSADSGTHAGVTFGVAGGSERLGIEFATEFEIRSARATEKPIKLKRANAVLGVYPEVSIKLARTRREEARRMVAQGIDRVIEARGTHETAHRTKQRVGQVYRYAIATGRAERDISVDLRAALAPVVTTHHAAITDPIAIGHLRGLSMAIVVSR